MTVGNECETNLFLEEIKKNRTELKLFIEASETRVLMKLEEFNEKVKKLETEKQYLLSKVETLEREIKKNSVLIYGLELEETNTTQNICDNLSQLLEINLSPVDIKDCFLLSSIPKKPVKVDFISNLKKKEVFSNCRKLKGTGIGIANDLTYKQRQEHKILRHHLNIARQNKKRSHIKGNKLYIESEVFTVELLSNPNNRKINSEPSTPTIQRNSIEEELKVKGQLNTGTTSQHSSKEENKGTPRKKTTQTQKKNISKVLQPSKYVAENNGRERLRSNNKQ